MWWLVPEVKESFKTKLQKKRKAYRGADTDRNDTMCYMMVVRRQNTHGGKMVEERALRRKIGAAIYKIMHQSSMGRTCIAEAACI